MEDLDNTIDQPDITDICKTLLPTTKYTFFFFKYAWNIPQDRSYSSTYGSTQTLPETRNEGKTS